MLPFISKEFSNSEIKILKTIEMPGSAYYKPRNRYRAEKILGYLSSVFNNANVKVVGLTALDISTTKGEFEDWGIFGLGYLSETACVVSTFRLNKNKNRLEERLRKVITHELGHTFGLLHCSRPECVMANYKGRMANLDNTGYHLCTSCRMKYKRYNKIQ